MADIADVMDALEQIALTACYPEGTTQPSVTGRPIDIGQGWVIADDMDAGLTVGVTFVSIYAVPSSTSKLPAPLNTGTVSVIALPCHGMAAEATDTGFVLTGQPYIGEYATAIIDGRVYSYAARQGDLVETVAGNLVALIPGATRSGSQLTLAGFSRLVVRVGSVGTLGQVIDRQRQNIMIGVWAPTPSDRTVVGRAVQTAIVQNLTMRMPDTSMAILVTQGVNLIDKYQNELAYRRDLTVQAQWDTVDAYDGYEITAVTVKLPAQFGRTYAY